MQRLPSSQPTTFACRQEMAALSADVSRVQALHAALGRKLDALEAHQGQVGYSVAPAVCHLLVYRQENALVLAVCAGAVQRSLTLATRL